MAKTKKLEIKVRYAGTPYVVNDLGENKSPRFELINTEDNKTAKKSNNPWDFDDYVLKHIDFKEEM